MDEMDIKERKRQMDLLHHEIRTTEHCPLCPYRTQAVPGEGPIDARLFMIGEAPGAEEDKAGRPFVGRAGMFLNRALSEAGLNREEIFITNAVKCRPPQNRKPRADELLACRPFLDRQLELVQPEWICTLGAVSTNLFLEGSLTKIHGKVYPIEYHGRKYQLFPIFHPAAVFRVPGWGEEIRKDLRKLKGLIS
jgi:DNA polymerase